MPAIVSAATALPDQQYPQEELTEAFADLMVGQRSAPPGLREAIVRTHRATTVESRHLALPVEAYRSLADFGAANDAFCQIAPALAARAARSALARAGLEPSAVDVVVSSTVTGLAVPSIDARLMPLLGLRQDVKRVPLVGLGCVAGASALARAADLLGADPDGVALVVAVELCSLTLQRDDTSMANVVASGLFGDGAAAVVMVGDRLAGELSARGVTVVGSMAHFFPDTERVMGWDVGSFGLRVVLSPTVPDLVAGDLRPVVDAFLKQHDLSATDVTRWIVHPGGPKVLTALEGALDLETSDTALTWQSLREVGNLSSASVLHVLEQTLEQSPPGDEAPAVLLAMGPGFCAELVLLRW
jgi:alkylresorcinol/alkylpyrone synthase